MTRGMLGLVTLLTLVGACVASTSSPSPPPVAAPVDAEPPATAAPPAATSPASPPATPAAEPPAPAPSPEVWRFTTLVTGGPASLVGANGYYELELDGDQATVRKVGERGTPELPPARVMTGTGRLALTDDARWPAARVGTVAVVLASATTKVPITLSVWVMGDELHGTWVHPGRKGEAKLGRAWGLLQGARGRGAPSELTDGERAPCEVCHRAFFVCEGMGTGACNSSNVAIDRCDARLAAARERAAEVPRGCGDWMSTR